MILLAVARLAQWATCHLLAADEGFGQGSPPPCISYALVQATVQDDEDVFLSSSEDMSFSTDVSDTRLRGTWDSDSDGFSTDVSESRKRRRRGIES